MGLFYLYHIGVYWSFSDSNVSFICSQSCDCAICDDIYSVHMYVVPTGSTHPCTEGDYLFGGTPSNLFMTGITSVCNIYNTLSSTGKWETLSLTYLPHMPLWWTAVG